MSYRFCETEGAFVGKLKAIVIVLLIPVIALAITACSFAPSHVPQASGPLPEGVTAKLSFPISTPESDSIKMLLINDTDTAFTYGSRFVIERWDSWTAKWQLVPFADNAAFDAVLHSLPPRSSGEATLSLKLLKSRLKYGRHRVWFLDDRVVFEFRVEPAARTH